MTSEIYIAGPETDDGFVLHVAPAVVSVAAGTSVTLSETAATVNQGDSAGFTATVAPTTAANSTPTGTVIVFDGATVGSVTLQSDGTAVFSTTLLPVGADSITAVYGWDNNFFGQHLGS